MLNRLAVIMVFLLSSSCLYAQALDDSVNKNALRLESLDSLLILFLDSINQRYQNTLDSIEVSSNNLLNGFKLSYDSVNTETSKSISQIQYQIDSLSSLNLPSTGLISKIDSIEERRKDRLKTIKARADELENNVEQQIESLHLPEELNGKAEEISSLFDKLDFPLPNASIPDLSLVENLSMNLPGINNPLQGENLQGLNTADLNLSSSDLNSAENIPNNINDVPTLVENKAVEMAGIDEVQNQLGEVNKLKETAQVLQDQEAMKEKLKQEATKEAMNHFAGKDQELQQAMELVSKYKKKYGSFQNLEEIAKKKPNEMRGKPLVERLLPGITIQIQQRNVWLFDFNPYVGYKFNGRLTVGVGWNERVAYNFDLNTFHSELRIFGPRLFGEFKILEGLKAHLEAEYMKTRVPPVFSSGNADLDGREWVFTTMAGIKKDFRFIKNIRGTATVLYNLYDPNHRSPYSDKLSMRFGFEFPVKKKTKESDQSH